MHEIKNLVLEIINFLDEHKSNKNEIVIFNKLKTLSLEESQFQNFKGNNPPKEQSLHKALEIIVQEPLQNLKEKIHLALEQLKWNVDNGSFYNKNSDVGNDYLNGNMNTELIGPRFGHFKSEELRLGLFLLEPNIFYKDHKHEAPELYINLTNGTEWRFGNSGWQFQEPGSIIYNEPFKEHAMRVNENPFLSIWCWPKNSSSECILVPRSDWSNLK